MEDSVSETGEVADTKRNALEDLGLIIASLSKTVGPRETNGIEDLGRPVVVGFNTGMELNDIVVFRQEQPIRKEFRRLSGFSSHNKKEVVKKARVN